MKNFQVVAQCLPVYRSAAFFYAMSAGSATPSQFFSAVICKAPAFSACVNIWPV